MYCYSLVRGFLDFLHRDWANLNLNPVDLRLRMNDIFAVQQAWNHLFGIAEEDTPRVRLHLSFKVDEHRDRTTRFMLNNEETKQSSDRNERRLKIQPPPVAELVFTKDDIWCSSSLTQTGLSVYSGKGIDRKISGNHEDHQAWASYSVISFSPSNVSKSSKAIRGHVQSFKRDIATRRSLGWLQRRQRYWVVKACCKCCHPMSTRSSFVTLSLVSYY